MVPIFAELKYIKPFVVQIWCGESKPEPLNEYLEQFVAEFDDLMQNGIEVNGKKVTISFRCCICDSPARSFVKGDLKFSDCAKKIIYSSEYFPLKELCCSITIWDVKNVWRSVECSGVK